MVRPADYGDAFADVYDAWYGDDPTTEPAVAFIAAAADGLPVVEIGVGTGRLAAPLAEQGLTVIGVDPSVAIMAAAPQRSWRAVVGDGRQIPLRVGGDAVVVLARNVVANMAGPDDAEAVFAEAARVVGDGSVIVEHFVPSDDAAAEDTAVGFELTRATDAEMTIIVWRSTSGVVDGAHVTVATDGVTTRPWRIRVRTPADLDAAAASAGLSLDARFETWDGTAFDADDSLEHVSVYRRRPSNPEARQNL